MKKLLITTLVLLGFATLLCAAGFKGHDKYGAEVDQFMPTEQYSESKTKGTTTINTTGYHAIRFKTSAVTSMTINGSGNAWPTVANTPETLFIRSEFTSAVFNRTSSATPTVVYWQAAP